MSAFAYPKEVLKMFLFLTEVLDARAVTPDGRHWGKVQDLMIQMGEVYPRVSTVVISSRQGLQQLDWSGVEGFNGKELRLMAGAEEQLAPFRPQGAHIQLRKEILDKQIVDTHGAKLERVNDLHFLVSERELRVVHVDVGFRGIVRRLGLAGPFDAFTDWLFSYTIPDHLVSWKVVQPLVSDPGAAALKLNVTQRKLSDIHPSDLADIMEDLDIHQRQAMFRSLDAETAAETLEEVDERLQIPLLESVGEEMAADILEEMAPDEAADLLQDLPEGDAESLMEDMETEKRDELRELLSYPEGSAGALMTTEYISAPGTETCAQSLEQLRSTEQPLESSAYIFVVDEADVLRGALTIVDLLRASPDTPLSEIMGTRPKTVPIDADHQEVVSAFAKYDFLALPVVDEGGRLKGLITLKDAVATVSRQFDQ